MQTIANKQVDRVFNFDKVYTYFYPLIKAILLWSMNICK